MTCLLPCELFRNEIALLMAVLLMLAPRSAQGTRPSHGQSRAQPTPSIIIRRPDATYTGPPNAMVKNEPFQVQVDSPGSGPSIKVTFTTAGGTTRTLTVPETGPGSGSYLSQPISAEAGAQETGNLKYAPGHLSRAMKGLDPSDGDQVTVSIASGQSATFRVYDTDFTEALGENNIAFGALRLQLSDVIVAAKTLLKKPNLAPQTVTSLNNTIHIATGKLGLMDRMQNLLTNPPARTGPGDYTGTLWWKVGTQKAYWILLQQSDPYNISTAAQERATADYDRITQQGHDAGDRFMIKILGLGLYVGTMNATMVGPTYTTLTGKNVFGQAATPEEIAFAAINLAAFVATFKLVPAAIDTAAGAAANELSGLGPRASTPVTPGLPSGRSATEAPQPSITEPPKVTGAASPLPPSANAPTAGNAAPRLIQGVSTEGLPPESVRALEFLDTQQVPPRELQNVASSARMSARRAGSPQMMSFNARTRQLINRVNELGQLEADARAAGVSEDTINTAKARANSAVQQGNDALEAFGRKLDFELRAQKQLAQGTTIIVDQANMASFRDVAGDAVANQVTVGNSNLYQLGTKLQVMENGNRMVWTQDEIRILENVRQMPNRANLAMYSDIEGPELVRIFEDNQLATLDRFLDAPNRLAIASGEATLPPPSPVGKSPQLRSEVPAGFPPQRKPAVEPRGAEPGRPQAPSFPGNNSGASGIVPKTVNTSGTGAKDEPKPKDFKTNKNSAGGVMGGIPPESMLVVDEPAQTTPPGTPNPSGGVNTPAVANSARTPTSGGSGTPQTPSSQRDNSALSGPAPNAPDAKPPITGNQNQASGGARKYFDPTTGDSKWVVNGDNPPAGWKPWDGEDLECIRHPELCPQNQYFSPQTGEFREFKPGEPVPDGWQKLKPTPAYPGTDGGAMHPVYPPGKEPRRFVNPNTGDVKWVKNDEDLPPGWKPLVLRSAPARGVPSAAPKLPEGAVFASATVEPDTTIEVQQPGYALVATADVVTAKRVEKGDHLDAKTTSSIAFDDGTGVIIDTVKKLTGPIQATVGLVSLFSKQDHPQGLPVQNGSTTMYVGSDKPFTTPTLSIDNVEKMPDKTNAVFLNSHGDKVGQVSTFNGLQVQPSSAIAIGYKDITGAIVQQGKVEGGALNVSAIVSFNQDSYKAGDHGVLQIRVGKYDQGVAATRFGGAANLSRERIKIIPLSDVKGLPSEVPFGDTNLPFQTMHPGEAKVAVIMPRSVPPKRVTNPDKDEVLKQANQSFENWLNQFPK